MIILIDEIDSESFLPIGNTNLPSFVAKFRSTYFDGIARFVPASGLPQNCVGHEFGAEICHESVTDFQIVTEGAVPEIASLDRTSSFRVWRSAWSSNVYRGIYNDGCSG
jgi:hypothetical protein